MQTVPTLGQVRRSPLFRAIVAAGVPLHPEDLRMAVVASAAERPERPAHNRLLSIEVVSAFVWVEAPQGQDFWSTVQHMQSQHRQLSGGWPAGYTL